MRATTAGRKISVPGGGAIGIGLLTWVLSEAELDVPGWVLIGLGIVAGILIVIAVVEVGIAGRTWWANRNEAIQPTATRPITWGDLVEKRVGFDPDTLDLINLAKAELVKMIDEGVSIRGDAFSDVSYQAFSVWSDRARVFLATALGEDERQRFERPTEITGRIETLERLRDRSAEWNLLTTRPQLEKAVLERRDYDQAARILLVDTPLYPDDDALPWRDDRLDLADRCRAIADEIESFADRREGEREDNIAMNTREIRKAMAQDDYTEAQARLDAAKFFARNTAFEYALRFRQDALAFFDEAYGDGLIARTERKRFERPGDGGLRQLPRDFRTIASRLHRE